MNHKMESRDYIKRFYSADTHEILLEHNRKRGRADEYSDYRSKWEATPNRQYDKPLELVLELNNYCNMACAMCYRNHQAFGQKIDMGDDMLDDILEFARANKIPSVRIGAFAECTLRHDITRVINKIGLAGTLDFWMITNGSQLGKHNILESIFDAGLTHLCISLDAATQNTFEKIRGKSISLAEIESNIHRFLTVRKKRYLKLPLLRVSFVVTSENEIEWDLFLEKWGGIADIIDFQNLIESDLDAVHKAIQENPQKNYEDCIDPIKMLVIKADGELLPCCNIDYVPIGKSVYYGRDYMNFMDYWNSEEHRIFSQKTALAKRAKAQKP